MNMDDPGMDLSYATLKARQRAERDGYSPSVALRTHRALSCLDRATQEPDDRVARFLFLWSAFNAAYAYDASINHRFSEKRLHVGFLNRLIASDRDKLLYHTVWEQFPNSIPSLLDDKYIYQPFWDFHSGKASDNNWEVRFRHDTQAGQRALGRMDTRMNFTLLF